MLKDFEQINRMTFSLTSMMLAIVCSGKDSHGK